MSNYTKNTNFTAKDNLTSGDPAKVIKGAEFDTEFNSIQTAVNSKADSNNSQLTGSTAAQAITTTGDVTVGGNLAVTGNATISGNLTFGDADTDTVSFSADIDSNIIPDDDNTYDLGSPTKEWRNLYVDGTANIDSLVADTADINGGTIDGVSITGTTASFSGEISANGGIALGDNDKATFGASDDLQIYHDGLNSVIADAGTGNIVIAADDFRLTNSTQTANMIKADEGGAVTLTYNGGNKLATTSTGVDVTGTVTADGLTVDGSSTLGNSGVVLKGQYSSSLPTHSNGYFQLKTNNQDVERGGLTIARSSATGGVMLDAVKVDYKGDVLFYEDTGTTAKMVWDASAESLGIGTTTAVSKLTSSAGAVDGTIGFGGSFHANTGAGGDAYVQLGGARSSGLASGAVSIINAKNSFGNGQLTFQTEGTERLRIDSLGNVGIGTSNPDSMLHVRKNHQADTSIEVSNVGVASASTTASFIVSESEGVAKGWLRRYRDGTARTSIGYDGNLTIETVSGLERMRIDSSGNLLVGKSASSLNTPGFEFFISGVQWATAANARPLLLNRTGSDGTIQEFRKDGATVGSIGVNSTTPYMSGNLGGFRLTSSGGAGVMIPTDTSGNASDADNDLGISSARWRDLYLSGGVYAGGSTGKTPASGTPNDIIQLGDNTWGSSGSGRTIQVNNQANTSNASYSFVSNVVYNNHMLFTWRGSTAGSITSPNTTTVAYNTSSDYRLKENVVEMQNASERVLALNPVRFTWTHSPDIEVDGFLAHEAQEVVPEAVTGTKDAMRTEEYEVSPAVLDDDGNVIEEAVMGTREVPDYQGIDQSKLVPLLTKALQEALTEIDSLKQRVDALENK